jgi:DNA-binding transcriptional regulator LsrR (DeoR family)
MSMTSQHPRIPLAKRTVILGLNWYAGMHFRDIASELGVTESGASKIVQRAKERAADPTDFDDVLACLKEIIAGG